MQSSRASGIYALDWGRLKTVTLVLNTARDKKRAYLNLLRYVICS